MEMSNKRITQRRVNAVLAAAESEITKLRIHWLREWRDGNGVGHLGKTGVDSTLETLYTDIAEAILQALDWDDKE